MDVLVNNAGVMDSVPFDAYPEEKMRRMLRLNIEAPGPVETDMLQVIPGGRKRAIKAAVYTGRFARPEVLAQAILWLGTDCPETSTTGPSPGRRRERP